MEDGKRRLSDMGVDVLLLTGTLEYYGRFGSPVAAAERFIPPHQIEHRLGWQGVVFSERGIPESPLQLECVPPLRDPALWYGCTQQAHPPDGTGAT